MKSLIKLLLLPIISIALFFFVYVNNIQPKLGLDLQGGVSVILTAEEGTDPELIEQAVEIMRTRICLLYTSPSPRDLSTSRMPSSA